MYNKDDDELEIDLLELLMVYRRHIWIILATTIIGAAAALLVTVSLIKPMYESTSMLYILNKSTSLTSLADIQIGTQLTKDYKVLVTSRPVTEKVIEDLQLDMTHEALVKKVSIGNPSDTRILTITVKDRNPMVAKTIADKFAEVAVARMAVIMDTTPPNIVENAVASDKPVSPSKRKNTMMGALAGMVLSMGIITLLYLLDDTVKSADDVQKYLQLSVLGSIPAFEEETDSGRSHTGSDSKKKSKSSSDSKSSKSRKAGGK